MCVAVNITGEMPMALTLDPKRCAILAMDFQNDILATTPNYREKHLLETVSRVLDAARRTEATVIHITVSFRDDYADAPPHVPLFQEEKAKGVMKAGSPMLHATQQVTGPMLWANLHLLFWLSLIPFATGWMGENHFTAAPSALYGVVLLMAAVAYWILQQLIIASQGPDSMLKKAIGSDWKGKLSPVLYAAAIPLAFWWQWISLGLYVVGAVLWLIPDRRIENVLRNADT